MRQPLRQFTLLTLITVVFSLGDMECAHADEGGISFWLPGEFGSLVAVPAEPGWSFATIYYHDSVSARASKNFNIGGRIVAGVNGTADLGLFGPTYTFSNPVLGGQAALSMLGAWGQAAHLSMLS